jgi:hypothetical protein
MIAVRKVSPALRLIDRLLWPVMFLLGGCRLDSIQETHRWHSQRIQPSEIDRKLTALVEGNERSRVTANRVIPFPLFHAPVFGGWRNYTVLQVEADVECWHVGWIHRQYPQSARPRSHVQRLPIGTREVRVLTQPIGFLTEYFALDRFGNQLPLRAVAEGVLGDGRYGTLRLF